MSVTLAELVEKVFFQDRFEHTQPCYSGKDMTKEIMKIIQAWAKENAVEVVMLKGEKPGYLFKAVALELFEVKE